MRERSLLSRYLSNLASESEENLSRLWGIGFLVKGLKEELTNRNRRAKISVSGRTEIMGLVSTNSANSFAGILCCGANYIFKNVRFTYNPAGVPAYIRRCAKAEEFSHHNTNRKELRDYFYTPLEWVEEGEISICMQSRWGTVSLTESG
jgi:hypothetical protein